VAVVFIWIFWHVTLCRWLSFSLRFLGLLCLQIQSMRGPPDF